MAEDGCHKFQKKKKIGDPDDISLVGDAGYFPDNSKYKDYLDHVKDNTEVRNLANGIALY